MNTYKFIAIAFAIVTTYFVGMEQAVAQDRCILFTFKGTPQEIEEASKYLRTEILKSPACREVQFGYPDPEYKSQLEKKMGRPLMSVEEEYVKNKIFPKNRLSFNCLEQSVDKNAFVLAGRAYLSLPDNLVTKSVELVVTTSCCTSTSCVSYQCAGDDVAHCWDKSRVCRLNCRTCTE